MSMAIAARPTRNSVSHSGPIAPTAMRTNRNEPPQIAASRTRRVRSAGRMFSTPYPALSEEGTGKRERTARTLQVAVAACHPFLAPQPRRDYARAHACHPEGETARAGADAIVRKLNARRSGVFSGLNVLQYELVNAYRGAKRR